MSLSKCLSYGTFSKRKKVGREREEGKEGRKKSSQLTVEKALSPLGNTTEVADLAMGEQRAKQ